MMRFEFKRQLEEMNDLVKKDTFQQELDIFLDNLAKKERTSTQTQQEIYNLQQQKQAILSELRKKLECIGQPDCRLEQKKGHRPAIYRPSQEIFTYFDDANDIQTCHLADIMADIDWGIFYNLDPDTTPVYLQKKYALEIARSQIQQLADIQITLNESSKETNHDLTRNAYRALAEIGEKNPEQQPLGFQAEIMVRNFLQKLQTKYDLPFKLLPADAYQDVTQKMDFVLHAKKNALAVEVEAGEPNGKKEHVGIQLTTNESKVGHKQEQIAKSMKYMKRNHIPIDNIALVTLPNTLTRELVQIWKDSDRPAGGPDQFMEKEDAENLFITICSQLFDTDTTAKYWKTIEQKF